jgi:hypothetical protein
MVAQPQPPRWSGKDYLEMELASPIRHEFLDGHVYGMAESIAGSFPIADFSL